MNVTATSTELDQYLAGLARSARPGDRLPTVRELMRRFGVSQMIVQRAIDALKTRGLIEAQVGRGTYFRADADAPPAPPAAARAPAPRSVLLLRRSIGIVRGRVLLEGLQRRYAEAGQRVLEVSYTDPEHARTVLKGLPHFDAGVVQSSFKTITIELLAALREKCDVIAVDGAALVGADVEAVGMEWGEPLARAIELLRRQGHRRIAFASSTQPFLATQLAQRRLEALREQGGLELQAIGVPCLPDEDYAGALIEQLRALAGADARLPFSALVAWGIEDGASLRERLAQAGWPVPEALSVVLLGRTDLVNEHAGFFTTVGCRVADQIEQLHAAIAARWADPARPYAVHLIPVALREGDSVAPFSEAVPRVRASRR